MVFDKDHDHDDHEGPHMQREWCAADEKILTDAHEFFDTAHRTMKVIDRWTDDVGHHIDPDTLPEDTKNRVIHTMWKTTMLAKTLDHDDIMESFKAVAEWFQSVSGGHMVIQEIDISEMETMRRRADFDPREGGGYL